VAQSGSDDMGEGEEANRQGPHVSERRGSRQVRKKVPLIRESVFQRMH
jgi:hypothetical protein